MRVGIQARRLYCFVSQTGAPAKVVLSEASSSTFWLMFYLIGVSALADAYIQESVKNGSSPFRVAWILSDTTSSIKHLQDGSADVAITYCSAAEKMAIAQDIATKRLYLFRDHFLIVGPIGNPAKLSSSQDVYSIMESVFRSAESKNTTSLPTRWLSRYDKSATNIKESQLWLGIGQVRIRASTVQTQTKQLGTVGLCLFYLVPPIHRISPSSFNSSDSA